MSDNQPQALSRALLQYLVVDLKAQAGAVFSVSENTPPFRVAQTERFDQRGDNLTQAAWMYKRAQLLRGKSVRNGQCVVMPLFRGEPVLRALLFLEGIPQEQQTFTDEQRLNLATLARLVEDGPAPGFDGWLLGQTKDPQRAQIEAALAASRGVVAPRPRASSAGPDALSGTRSAGSISTRARSSPPDPRAPSRGPSRPRIIQAALRRAGPSLWRRLARSSTCEAPLKGLGDVW